MWCHASRVLHAQCICYSFLLGQLRLVCYSFLLGRSEQFSLCPARTWIGLKAVERQLVHLEIVVQADHRNGVQLIGLMPAASAARIALRNMCFACLAKTAKMDGQKILFCAMMIPAVVQAQVDLHSLPCPRINLEDHHSCVDASSFGSIVCPKCQQGATWSHSSISLRMRSHCAPRAQTGRQGKSARGRPGQGRQPHLGG